MKKITLFSAALLSFSCTADFLDVKPKGQVIASTISDYNNLLEYSRLTQIASNSILLNTWNILGDDVAALEPHYATPARFGAPDSRNHRLFEWADDVYRPDEDTEEVNAFYHRIYTANKIIHEVLDAEGGSEQQKLQYRAEALAHRAFAYFNLVNFFGKPYDPATAATDLGVPLVLKSDFTQQEFKRATVQEVYDRIVADLHEAIPFLPLQQNTSNRYSRAAAALLLGKVYLFAGNADEASRWLNQSHADLPTQFTVSGKVGLIDYNTATVSPAPIGYVFLTPDVGSTASQGHGYPETLKGELAAGITWLGYGAPLIISPETHALFTADDRRLLLYSNAYSPVAPGPGPLLPTGLYRSRAGFIGGSVGAQLPDLYLLLAEARARTNDLSGAREALITLRSKRMPAATAADVPETREALIRFIIDERRREFATLGFRWFDMRRLSVDPLFAGASYTHTLYDATGEVKATFHLKPERFVLRFSEKLLTQSPQLVNNP
ncbi:RagB/SusD family nutrient uptake outer membrane protein [Parapedobacter deserti]|uniref:RagB/SusD family nutrient uptake outer membrane protein n=1 Tax=Parapedobacter deserti TaxID=1912957 RepID=A0ABV7JHY9_9SPHI